MNELSEILTSIQIVMKSIRPELRAGRIRQSLLMSAGTGYCRDWHRGSAKRQRIYVKMVKNVKIENKTLFFFCRFDATITFGRLMPKPTVTWEMLEIGVWKF